MTTPMQYELVRAQQRDLRRAAERGLLARHARSSRAAGRREVVVAATAWWSRRLRPAVAVQPVMAAAATSTVLDQSLPA